MPINNPSLPVNPNPAFPAYRAQDIAGQDMVSSIVGFDVQNQRPIDGRTVVLNIIQRNNIRFAFYGLEVFVVELDKKFRFINPNYKVGPTFVPFVDADWLDLTIIDNSRTFIDIYEPAIDGLFTSVAPATPDGGGFFLVKTVNNALVNVILNSGDAATPIKTNGQIIFSSNSNKWEYLPPLEPTQITQFPHTAITDWDEQVKTDIALNAIIPYIPAAVYKEGQVVYTTTIDQGQEVIDMYRALRPIVISDVITNAGAWKPLTTLDYRKMKFRLVIDNTKGLGANVETPSTIGGDDVTLSANEIDRRIQDNGGGGRFPINGGNAYTSDDVLGPKIIP